MNMLTQERRDEILRVLSVEGRVDLAGLGERFGVSEDTVRRDLRELDAAGLIRRVRGGALPRSPAPAAFAGRADRDLAAKGAIARVGVERVQPGMVLGIDAGTSTLAFARALPAGLRCTVVTNSLPVASELGQRDELQVVMLGGSVMGSSQGTVGAGAYRALARMRLDMVVIGTCGVHVEAGLTAMDAEEAEIKRGYVERGERVLVLATSEKLGVVEAFGFAEIGAGDELVTDADSAHPLIDSLRQRGVSVTLCGPAPGECG
ncbi:DeoR/GlpR family DNA-binding transcription regulator [Haliangium ochraceum]|uniref:Transcriptional regulator, DeoR family n=1 Tax=Haliangium ochraceum (strain DSM 14365 / JCM 11303 / SMP-2) TaxID=502025 RepID=D0LYT9_HALO1|nr:DeoR/GlpR family DNA-binding transcription regulator [Haliangium ochraceum]ACY14409.1 transcriptional regulator, DeoR family [Haliangium ochraceum DSM 14365]